jgi:hypothetical protein
MSLAASIWTAAGAVAAAAAAAALLVERQQPEPDRRARRWLAITALLWGGAFIARDVAGGPIRASVPLTPAGVLTLAALPALVLAIVALGSPRPPGGLASLIQLRLARAAVPGIADACLLVVSLFLIAWVAVLAAAYMTADVGRGTFAADLINPIAYLAVLACVIQFAARAGWRALVPVGALVLATAGDFLAVGARATGMYPGWSAQIAWLAAIVVVGATPQVLSRAERAQLPQAQAGAPEPRLPAYAAIGAAAVAVLLTLGRSLAGTRIQPIVIVAVAAIVLALAVRLAGLLRHAAEVSALSREASRQFSELADRTSDAVLVCG